MSAVPADRTACKAVFRDGDRHLQRVLARQPIQRLSGGHHLANLGQDLPDHARLVGLEHGGKADWLLAMSACARRPGDWSRGYRALPG